MEKKQEVNFVDLKKLLKGRKYEKLPKKEQLEICDKIIKQYFPSAQKK